MNRCRRINFMASRKAAGKGIETRYGSFRSGLDMADPRMKQRAEAEVAKQFPGFRLAGWSPARESVRMMQGDL